MIFLLALILSNRYIPLEELIGIYFFIFWAMMKQ